MPTSRDLAELERKYAFMVDAHRAHRAQTKGPSREAFREIGRTFPGSLKELERVPFEVLVSRLTEVRGARDGGPMPAWVILVDDYHRVLRRILGAIAGRDDGDLELDPRVAAELAERPRRRKLETIALEWVAMRAMRSPDEVHALLGFLGGRMRSPVGTGAD